MPTITTREASIYAASHTAFQNNSGSLRGHWHDYLAHKGHPGEDRCFVVWTYQEPLFIYSEANRQWYGNTEKYSRTSSKHKGCAQPVPGDQIEWRDRQTMREIANNGLIGAVRQQFKEAA